MGRYTGRHRLNIIVPEANDRTAVNDIIYNELARGIVKDSSRSRMLDIIAGLKQSGVEGIILGCTELPLLVNPADIPIPAFDTTELHAKAAVELALGGK